MRCMAVGCMTKARRAMQYIDTEDLSWIAGLFAETEYETMFETRVVKVDKTVYVETEVSKEDLDAMLEERLLLLFNN